VELGPSARDATERSADRVFRPRDDDVIRFRFVQDNITRPPGQADVRTRRAARDDPRHLPPPPPHVWRPSDARRYSVAGIASPAAPFIPPLATNVGCSSGTSVPTDRTAGGSPTSSSSRPLTAISTSQRCGACSIARELAPHPPGPCRFGKADSPTPGASALGVVASHHESRPAQSPAALAAPMISASSAVACVTQAVVPDEATHAAQAW